MAFLKASVLGNITLVLTLRFKRIALIKRQPSLTIALFTLIFAGCNMFNNPLKPFIEEASRREGTPGVGPGDPGGVLPGLPGGPGEGTPGQPGNGQPGNGNGQPGNGAGYTPLNAGDFLARANNNSWEMDGHYRLTESVAVPDYWTPIGFSSIDDSITYFTGSFDGGGFNIYDITILPPDAGDARDRGMFAVIGPGGNVRNVRLVDVNITGGTRVGGIAATNRGVVENSSVSGIIGVTGTQQVGGIVGWNYGVVRNSLNTANISASANTAGGIVGHNIGQVRNSLNRGNISANANAGGVVGNSPLEGLVQNCVALNGTVTASVAGAAGRILGWGGGSLVTNNHACATMTIVVSGLPLDPLPSDTNGMTVYAAQFNTEGFWTGLGWNFTTIWIMAGGVPALR